MMVCSRSFNQPGVPHGSSEWYIVRMPAVSMSRLAICQHRIDHELLQSWSSNAAICLVVECAASPA